MNIFANKFTTLISEQEGPPAEMVGEAPPGGDTEAFDKGLDPGTEPGSFNDVPENPAIALRKQQYGATMETLRTWVFEVEGWVETLNGLEGNSMNSQLNSADCDSIMADVQRSESKKISRLAQDLSGLSEALKQYLLSAEREAASRDTI
tara:strand:+ start:525 stop:971 length:447 start_codon:yes stop_codon:yes gene_type:complete